MKRLAALATLLALLASACGSQAGGPSPEPATSPPAGPARQAPTPAGATPEAPAATGVPATVGATSLPATPSRATRPSAGPTSDASPVARQAIPLGFRTVADTPLSGGPTRFDYQALDAGAHRLYIAHLSDGILTVFDTRTRMVVKDIPNVDGVHGVVVAPDIGRAYASATGTDEVAVIDTSTLAVVARAPGGDYPDGLAYDPEVGKVYVSDEHGGTDTVIDARSNQRVATIPLAGDVGNTQYDPASHRAYAAVGDGNQLVAVNPTTDQVSGRTDLPGCDGAHGLLIDPDRRLAFVACEGNAKLLVVDMQTMQVTWTHDVGQDPDVLAFDPALRRLYVAAESGIVTAFAEDGGGLQQLAQGLVGPNAHSVAVNPDSHHLYLPLANLDGRPVLREVALEPPVGG